MQDQQSGEWRLPWRGRCLCGDLRFEVTEPPLLSMACHCRGCQRLTASAFSLSLAIPTNGFAVTRGEPVRGGLHAEHDQMFCDRCKSWVFTRIKGFDFVNLRTTMIDDIDWDVPFIESKTEDKLPWAETPAVHGFAGFPEIEDWQRLIAAYAEQGARPG